MTEIRESGAEMGEIMFTVELTAQEVRDIQAFVSGYPLPGADDTDRNARMTRIFEIWDEALTRVGPAVA